MNKITAETFAAIVTARNGIVGCQIEDDCDYGEKFQAVIGQLDLISIGLHSNATSATWQLEAARLASAWYAESDEVMPARDYYAHASFKNFADAMAATADLTAKIAEADDFATV